ncbi:MAG: hypothetical protein H7A37_02460 [Chlamydiales bacterium]|nr:hypothetical protein [Chlamydiia bacterium]MCP5507151.1 hypothetical protein [Chlamydiales bacterium]
MNRFFFIIFTLLIGICSTLPGKMRTEPWLTESAIVFLEDFFAKNPNAAVLNLALENQLFG